MGGWVAGSTQLYQRHNYNYVSNLIDAILIWLYVRSI